MSCKCTVLASATPPVLEVISHGKNGLLCDFFDEEGFVQQAQHVLSDPAAYRKKLGQTARQTVLDTYSQEVTLPRIKAFYNRHVSARN
jgi:glycosyltransferase involved in cell wall biosynthesis